MSQNDLVIDNQSFPATRADINSALQALGSLSSGSTAPTTTYANMLWYDTGANILKMRSEADDAWISMGYLHQGENQFHILDNTYVSDTSGNHVGLLGDQSTATWETGTSTTESLVSPAKVKAAVEVKSIGYGQTWQTPVRSVGTTYQNTTEKPILVIVSEHLPTSVNRFFEVSTDGSTWVGVSRATEFSDWKQNHSVIIPVGSYYRLVTGTFQNWAELR